MLSRAHRRRGRQLRAWLHVHREVLRRIAAGVVVVFLVLQIFYPGDKLPFLASVDGVGMSGWNKSDAIKELDRQAKAQLVNVKLVSSFEKSVGSAKPEQIGISVSNQKRIAEATYPWYLRIIPTSLLWFGLFQSEQAPSYKTDKQVAKSYIEHTIGTGCKFAPRDASLKLDDSNLVLVPSESGGTCQEDQAAKLLTSATPRPNRNTEVKIPVDVIAPSVGDNDAKELANKLNKNSRAGVKIKAANKQVAVDQSTALSWLDFKSDGDKLAYGINQERANVYLAKKVTPIIARPAGVTKVSTLDFAETSRSDGATGQTLALAATLSDIARVLDGKKSEASAAVQALQPATQYSRSYTKSSTGIAALLKFYDDDNPGSFGVSFSELGGQSLAAEHNASKQFVTASTYKLFVAFSTLRRVDAGQMKWDDADISNGRNLSTCFDDMIVKSDNACAEALIKKIGASALNADIKSIGLNSTAFRSDNNLTTSADLANYLTQLQNNKLPIKPESRDRLLGAMKRNVYRQGIPTGASGQTADKVGFLWGLLHDAAIVYSPKGTYVLTVMSDGSSWAAIADLTRKIEALR